MKAISIILLFAFIACAGLYIFTTKSQLQFKSWPGQKAPFTPPYLNPKNTGGTLIQSNDTYESVYFGFDKYALTYKSEITLNNIIKLNSTSAFITIILDAYTDPEGASAYNKHLSLKHRFGIRE